MGINEKILSDWKKSFLGYKKLKLKEAQELYKLSINDESISLKNIIMDTLHVVIKFIEKSGLTYLNCSFYDMNDIINTCIQIWIEKISNGDLLRINNYAEMFDNNFYTKLTEGLGITKVEISKIAFLNSDNFIEYFMDFLEFYQQNGDDSYSQYLEHIKNNKTLKNYFLNYYFDEKGYLPFIQNLYQLFNAIIKSFENDEKQVNLSKTRVEKLKYIILNNALVYLRNDINSVAVEDTANKVIESMINRKIDEIIIENNRLTDRQKDVIVKRYGLMNNKPQTLEQVAKDFGVTRVRIRQIEDKAIRQLWRVKELRQYR